VKVKVDKTVLASVALHVLVLGWVMLSFSTKALEMIPEDSVGVDISIESQAMAGIKTGKKENPKPLAEKVAEAKPVEDTVGKISEKPPVVTETAPPPQPKAEEKPVEKKPDPPKPVVENKPKEEPKPVEKKPDPPKAAENAPTEKKPEPVKPDPIAEAIKKEEKKPPPKPVQAAKPPEPAKPKIVERHFDQTQIAALLDKRDPSRQAATGETLNSNAALGTAKGSAANNSANWQSAFMQRVRQCFNFPYNGVDVDAYFANVDIAMKPDGTLAGTPVIQGTEGPNSGVAKAMAENAVRAIIQCAPYTSLPKEQYASWKLILSRFGLKELR
jgi:outer membrane biosynthesis protein TonB